MTLGLFALAVLAAAPIDAAAPEKQTAEIAVLEGAIEQAAVQPSPAPQEGDAAPSAGEALEEASTDQSEPRGPSSAEATIRDPFEGFNRAMFSVNDAIDRAALEPIARGYRAATPKFFRTGVSNVLSNLGEPVTFANALLQGNINRAGSSAGRFALNTTFGLLGVLDPAETAGLESRSEDFGQTLAVWGVGPGPYLVLPLFGPSTLRDGLGRGVDVALSPWTYLDGHDMDEIRLVERVVGVVSARESVIEQVDSLRRTSADPYVTLRSLYGQARASAILNGAQNVQDLPDFGDEGSGVDTP